MSIYNWFIFRFFNGGIIIRAKCIICGKEHYYSKGKVKNIKNYMCREHHNKIKPNCRNYKGKQNYAMQNKIWELARLRRKLIKKGVI